MTEPRTQDLRPLRPSWPARPEGPPRLSASTVPRGPLLSRLKAATLGRATLVVAPAGYGKSVLLAQLAATELDREVLWCGFRAADGDAARMAFQLVAAIGVEPAPAESLLEGQLRLGDDMVDPDLLGYLLHSLSMHAPALVVLDDVHLLSERSVQALSWLAAHCDPRVQFVLGSRTDLSAAFGRLLRAGEVTILDRTDLAMTPDDGAAVVESVAGVRLDRTQRVDLNRRTEGWAAATQVGALALAHHRDVEGFLSTFEGNDRTLARYLMDEVVSREPATLQEVLMATCVVNSICPDLAKRLTGRDDCAAVLAELERRCLFLTAMDDDGEWYRFHPLFAECLRAHLRSHTPERERDLLLAAADWYLERGEPFAAGELMVRANAWTEMFEMVARHGWKLYEGGFLRYTVGWCDRIPAEVLDRDQGFVMTMAAQSLAMGDTATCDGLLSRMEARGLADEHLRARDHVVRCLGIQYDTPIRSVQDHAGAVRNWLATDPQPPPGRVLAPLEDPTLIAPMVDISQGRAEAYVGNLDSAREMLGRVMGNEAFPSLRVGSGGSLAHLEARAGELVAAEALALKALETADAHGLTDHECRTDALLALAIVATERDDPISASEDLAEAERLARRARRTAISALVLAQRCQWAIATRNHAAAIQVADRFRSSFRHRLDPLVAARLSAAQARLWLAAGRTTRARNLLVGLPRTVETSSAAAAVAASSGNPASLEAILVAWEESGTRDGVWTKRDALEHLVWQAVLAEMRSDDGEADRAMATALDLVEAEGVIRTFLDLSPIALRPLQRCIDAQSSPHAAAVAAALGDDDGAPGQAKAALTDRELAVLAELATPASNKAIAEGLYVSGNTLKTHLRRIYRKLGVANRREAVDKAEALGLLPASRHETPPMDECAPWDSNPEPAD